MITKVGTIEFDRRSVIGRGSSGTVVLKGAFNQETVAVKRFLKCQLKLITDDFETYRFGHHDNVIRLLHMEDSNPDFFYLALELCSCNLADYIDPKYPGPAIARVSLLRQASEGLMHIHSLKAIHGSIKPSNVLISQQDNGSVIVKLAEFGLRMSIHEFWNTSGERDNEGWIAPEILSNSSGHSLTTAIDIFPLGCVYFFTLTRGDHPFGQLYFTRDHRTIKGEYDLTPLTKNNRSEAAQLIERMLHPAPEKRPTIQDILGRPDFWEKDF